MRQVALPMGSAVATPCSDEARGATVPATALTGVWGPIRVATWGRPPLRRPLERRATEHGREVSLRGSRDNRISVVRAERVEQAQAVVVRETVATVAMREVTARREPPPCLRLRAPREPPAGATEALQPGRRRALVGCRRRRLVSRVVVGWA